MINAPHLTDAAKKELSASVVMAAERLEAALNALCGRAQAASAAATLVVGAGVVLGLGLLVISLFREESKCVVHYCPFCHPRAPPAP
jgi:hypothetical protein